MTTVDLDKLKAQLTDEEGRRNFPYVDTCGNLTIGIGRNLRAVGLRDNEIELMFSNDIAAVEAALRANIPWVFDLDEIRLRVFYDLCFNMGIATLMSFSHMLDYAKNRDFDGASYELHHSLWDTQVGNRAATLENMLRTGSEP